MPDSKSNTVALSAFMIFLISPFFWPNVPSAGIAISLLSLATGLFFAALMYRPTLYTTSPDIQSSLRSWLFLLALILPTACLLIAHEIKSPWHAWQSTLFISSAWLIFRMCQAKARNFLESSEWCACISIIAHAFILYAVLQAYELQFYADDRLFAVWNEYTNRFAGPLAQPNAEGLFLAITSSAILSHAFYKQQSRIWPWLLTVILPLAGVWMTSSRSAALLIIGLCILLTWKSSDKFRILANLSLVISASLILAAYVLQASPAEAGPLARSAETSGIFARIFIWDMSWHLFLENPWLGIGLGNFPAHGMEAQANTIAIHPEWIEISKNVLSGHIWSHNLILQALMSVGLFGGLAVAGLYFAVGRKLFILLFNNHSDLGEWQGVLGATLILTQGLVSVPPMLPYFMVLLATYLAAIFHSKDERERYALA